MTVPLSVNLMPSAPVGALVELAQLAESVGCRRCWVYDEGTVTRDVYVTLAAIAAGTQSIRLGPGITNPFVRHPGATAVAIATLDEVSGGRAYLGLGAGGGLTLGPLGIDRRRPLTAVREMVETTRRLFAGERVTHDGHAFSFADAAIGFARPDIEIILAGRGPKMTALGGELADGFCLSYIHKSLLAGHVETLRSAAGERPFHITYSTTIATTDEEIAAVRGQLTFRLVDSPSEVKERLGLDDAQADAIQAALAAGDKAGAAELVDPAWVESFAIVGTADECARELDTLMRNNGLDEFQLPVQDIDVGADLIERVAAIAQLNGSAEED
jgi:5,10-methylenetetrahydromethanopterin reductase